MKKIIVTGATSMIGISLIKEAIRNSVEVVALDIGNSPRMDKLPKSELITFIECDLRNIAAINKELLWGSDCFYHFAWIGTSRDKRDDPNVQLLNVGITLDCVSLCHEVGCKKFVGAGSQAEYGYVDGVITPMTPCDPQISYGIAKYTAGKLGKKLSDTLGITFIWGRIFSVYGPNDNPNTMIRYALEKFLTGEVAKFSSGQQKWNYLFEDDVGVIFYLIGCKCLTSKVYCIASEDTRILRSFIEEIKTIVNDKAIVKFSDARGNGIEPDISDLLRDIGSVPTTSFCEGIKKILAEYK